MGTRVAASQIFRWAGRSATSSVLSAPELGRCHLQPVCVSCRLLCSSSGQQLSPLSGKAVTAPPLRSLLDMGFTETQAERICDVASTARGENAAKHALSTLTCLFVLGLSPSTVLKVLEKCPQLFSAKESQLQQRITNLRKLGLVEGSLQRVVTYYPHVLTVPVKSVKNTVAFLKQKCLFTTQQVTDILRDSPSVVVENKAQLEYKFQYVYFRMGVKQAELVKSRLFRFTLEEVRHRHCFLERRGLYQTPDKKGQTTIVNPKLDTVLNVNQDTFITQVAKATVEEYDVFKRLMAREWQEQEQQGRNEADSDDEGEEEEDEEDEEDEDTAGKSGYRRRKK